MITRLLAAALAAFLALPAAAADFSDPDWPCIQRKVPNLSWGMMWTGLPIDESLGDWREDEAVRGLVPTLAVRRTPMEEAEARIAGFAEDLGQEADRRLALLFKGVFELIDRERAQIVSGIGRYARKQQALADRIDAARAELAELRALEEPDFDQQDRMEELEDRIKWDTRVFDERKQSLTYVCESPVILEKRAFAIARAIMRHLP
jgi:hypothetical protein